MSPRRVGSAGPRQTCAGVEGLHARSRGIFRLSVGSATTNHTVRRMETLLLHAEASLILRSVPTLLPPVRPGRPAPYCVRGSQKEQRTLNSEPCSCFSASESPSFARSRSTSRDSMIGVAAVSANVFCVTVTGGRRGGGTTRADADPRNRSDDPQRRDAHPCPASSVHPASVREWLRPRGVLGIWNKRQFVCFYFCFASLALSVAVPIASSLLSCRVLCTTIASHHRDPGKRSGIAARCAVPSRIGSRSSLYAASDSEGKSTQ